MNIVLANQFKNEQNRLKEWLAYYKELKICDFILVDDHSSDNSLNEISKVKNINVTILKNEFLELNFTNSSQTENYRANIDLANTIIQNFKKIQNICYKKYGPDTCLGFFDVDEFIFSKNYTNTKEIIIEKIKNIPTLCLPCFEVDSDLFDPNFNWITQQTTRSMSEENRKKGTRNITRKTFQNLNFIDKINFYRKDLTIGDHIHTGGLGFDEGTHTNSEELAFLHYRSPMYDYAINKKLMNTEYDIVAQTGKRAKENNEF